MRLEIFLTLEVENQPDILEVFDIHEPFMLLTPEPIVLAEYGCVNCMERVDQLDIPESLAFQEPFILLKSLDFLLSRLILDIVDHFIMDPEDFHEPLMSIEL